jgi:biopolymer transport protein ExbD
LEIVPLIDIMFFLLAAFMVVSIGKIHLKSLKLTLPTNVPVAQKEAKEDFINIAITANGEIQLNKEVLPTLDLLSSRLTDLYQKNKDQKFLLSADKDAKHGDVVAVLARLRSAGFQKVAFSINGESKPNTAISNATAPAGSTPVSNATAPTSSTPVANPAPAK